MSRQALSGAGVLGAVAATLLALICPAPILAHVPAVEGSVGFADGESAHGGTTVIGGPEKSRAIYGYRVEGEDEAFAFTTTEAVTRTVRVIVPAYPEHEGFRPGLVLEADGEEVEWAEESSSAEREGEFEPFSLTRFWQGAEFEHAFEPGVQYVVTITPGTGSEESGRYVLTFSGPEEFTGEDILGTLRGLPRIWFGAYGGAAPRWNPLGAIPLLVVAAGVAALGYAIWKAVRRRSSGEAVQ
jgi:hypothetical protein